MEVRLLDFAILFVVALFVAVSALSAVSPILHPRQGLYRHCRRTVVVVVVIIVVVIIIIIIIISENTDR